MYLRGGAGQGSVAGISLYVAAEIRVEVVLGSSYAQDPVNRGPRPKSEVISVVFDVDTQTENADPLLNRHNDLDFTDYTSAAQRNYVAYISIGGIYHSRELACEPSASNERAPYPPLPSFPCNLPA